MKSHDLYVMKRPLARQQGLSLVELMISMTIGMFLLLGLGTLLMANSETSQELNKAGNQIENGRYGIQVLTDDIRLAGFLGTYKAPGAPGTWTTPDPCATALASLGFDTTVSPVVVPVAIHGYAGASALPASCATAVTNRAPGTAVLVVRRVSTTPIAPSAIPAGGSSYLQVTNCPDITLDPKPFVIDTDTSKFTLMQNDCIAANVAPARQYLVHIYYVSTCSDCGNDTIPTLKMVEFNKGALTTTSLVEGIQNMQLDYGIDMDADGAVDCYTSDPTSPPAAEIDVAVCPQPAPAYVWTDAIANWSNVMAVRVNLLARSLETTPYWVDSRTYNMGLTSAITTPVAANDAYKRHVYSSVARLYNISGQRETE